MVNIRNCYPIVVQNNMKAYRNILFSILIFTFISSCSSIKSTPIESNCNQVEIVFMDSPKKLKARRNYPFIIKSNIESEIFISISNGAISKMKDGTYMLIAMAKGELNLVFIYESKLTKKKERLCSVTYNIY